MNLNEINKIKENIKNYKRTVLKPTSKIASVLIPLVIEDSKLHLLLTKRNNNLRNHSGEFSFPGGMQEPNESLLDTALRETEEEIGIKKSEINIIGSLDDEISLAKYRVTPFVGIINKKKLKLSINESEVEKVLSIPINFFLQKDTFWTEHWIRLGKYRTVYFYLYNNEIIWGLTGKIIYKAVKLIKL